MIITQCSGILLIAESGKALWGLVRNKSTPAINDLEKLISELDIRIVNIRNELLQNIELCVRPLFPCNFGAPSFRQTVIFDF